MSSEPTPLEALAELDAAAAAVATTRAGHAALIRCVHIIRAALELEPPSPPDQERPNGYNP